MKKKKEEEETENKPRHQIKDKPVKLWITLLSLPLQLPLQSEVVVEGFGSVMASRFATFYSCIWELEVSRKCVAYVIYVWVKGMQSIPTAWCFNVSASASLYTLNATMFSLFENVFIFRIVDFFFFFAIRRAQLEHLPPFPHFGTLPASFAIIMLRQPCAVSAVLGQTELTV